MNVVLRSSRRGHPTVGHQLTLRRDLELRGGWQDRSGQRIVGGTVLGVGLAPAGGLLLGGGAYASSLDTWCSGLVCIPPATGAWILFGGLSGGIEIASAVIGTLLLGMNDRSTLSSQPLPPRVAPFAAPVEQGAILGVVDDPT